MPFAPNHLIYQQLAAVRAKLIASFTTGASKLTAGNCFVTLQSRPMPTMGRLYVQIFRQGITYDQAGGGNKDGTYTIGVAIRNVLASDQTDRYEAIAKELLELVEDIGDCLHLWPGPAPANDDPLHLPDEWLFPEPLEVRSEDAPAEVVVQSQAGYVDQAKVEVFFRARAIKSRAQTLE